MRFNLNKFLISLSSALDFVEMDILGHATNHSKRVAYISYKLGEKLGLKKEELFDLVSLAILHDNGASKKFLHDTINNRDNKRKSALESLKEHCDIGEENISKYPLLTNAKNVIKYHHENYLGTGFYGLKGEDIPLMSQVIFLGDILENNFDLRKTNLQDRKKIINFLLEKKNILFSSRLIDAFIDISKHHSFWMDLQDEFINQVLEKIIPCYYIELNWEEIREITKVFSNIIDSKSRFTQKHSSGLAQKTSIMADYYDKDYEEKMKLMISADLHDIGKLAISNDIIDKPGRLTENEIDIIKNHTYYTRISLDKIKRFEDITQWASNHHEKLDGTGYPYGLKETELDFNSRLLACLDIYQALTEERPYRNGLTHSESINILKNMSNDGLIDSKIVEDIDSVFS